MTSDRLIPGAVPAASITAVGVTTVGIAVVLPLNGAVVGASLLVASVVAPAVTVRAAHRTERRTSALRGDAFGRTVELLDAALDLLAFNAADRNRTRLEEADRSLSTLLRRAATACGVGAASGCWPSARYRWRPPRSESSPSTRDSCPAPRSPVRHSPARARRRRRRVARRRGPAAHRTA